MENDDSADDNNTKNTRRLTAIQLFRLGSVRPAEPVIAEYHNECTFYKYIKKIATWFTGTSSAVVPTDEIPTDRAVRMRRISVSAPNLVAAAAAASSIPSADSPESIVESIRRVVSYKMLNMAERRVASAPQLAIRPESWRPPSRHGLENSHRIIPHYYFTNHDYDQIFEIDYLHMILDDIRNMRPLNRFQLEYVMELDGEHKNTVILEFHDVNRMMIDTLDGLGSHIVSKVPSKVPSGDHEPLGVSSRTYF